MISERWSGLLPRSTINSPMIQATRAAVATRAATLPNVERREIPSSIGHMLLSCVAGSSLMCSRGLPAGQAHGLSFTLGGPLAGESADLCWRDAEVVFEVSGELVRAEVAVRGDDVLDGYRG
jgi:hypothetical protein